MKRVGREEFWRMPDGVLFCYEDPNQRLDRSKRMSGQGVYPEEIYVKDYTYYDEDGIPTAHYEHRIAPMGEYIPELEGLDDLENPPEPHCYELDLTPWRGDDLKGDPDKIFVVYEKEELEMLREVIDRALEIYSGE